MPLKIVKKYEGDVIEETCSIRPATEKDRKRLQEIIDYAAINYPNDSAAFKAYFEGNYGNWDENEHGERVLIPSEVAYHEAWVLLWVEEPQFNELGEIAP